MKKYLTAASAFYLSISQEVYAALPRAHPPSSGGADSNILTLLKGYFKDAAIFIGLVISVTGFLWLSWIALSDINEARKGRKEWGEVGLTVIAGAAAFLFVSYMLGQAAGVL